MRRAWLHVVPLALTLLLSGCIGTLIGVTADAAIAVVKVPFKVAGAVVDVMTPDAKDKSKEKGTDQTKAADCKAP